MNGAAPAQLRTVKYGSASIAYQLTFAPRRRLSISVHPDLSVTATAPEGRSLEEIDERVRARAGWILKQLRGFEQYHPLPRPKRYVGGETHLYLGRQYRLKLSTGKDGVRLRGQFFHVTTADRTDTGRIAELLEGWYRRHAREIFPQRLERSLEMIRGLIDTPPGLRIRKMSKRWGSCSDAGTLTLNLDLIKAPSPCIDYVIVHELCHLKVMNHGERFYRFLSHHMPDWKRRRERLNSLQI